MEEDTAAPAAATTAPAPPTTTTDPLERAARLAHTFSQHRDTVAASAWMPDSRRFFSSGPDRLLLLCDVTGKELGRWRRPLAVQDLALAPDGRHLILACSTDRLLQVVRLSEAGPAAPSGSGAYHHHHAHHHHHHQPQAPGSPGGAGAAPQQQQPPPPPPLGEEVSVQESAPLTALTISSDGRYMLANLQCHTMHLWSLEPLLLPSSSAGGASSPSSLPPPMPPMPPSGAGLAAPPPPSSATAAGLPSWIVGSGAAGAGAAATAGAAGGPATAAATTTTAPAAAAAAASSAGTSRAALAAQSTPRPPRGSGAAAFAASAASLGPLVEYVANGGRPGRFVLRSSFGGGGGGCGFVAHGGEDAALHLWHRATGTHLLRLEGHTGPVNAVSWNPARPHLLASCSDDRSVRLWVSQEAEAEAEEGGAVVA